ncbi:MAG: acriflavine resistance protein, partial [Bacteriovoracaceae bacterium]|nr:acriflavine resistance protein [Bacteriovoracaceae bacterium]
DAKKLQEYELTSSDILSAITAEQIEQPAGRIENKKGELNVRVLGEAKSAEEFGKIRINSRGGGPNYNPITLSKISRIEEGISDFRAISRYNGKTAVGLGIVKQHGANAVAVSELVYKKVDAIRPSLLPGYHVDVRLDSTKYIRDSVNELNFTLLLAAILTSLVCYLFLGSWSSTINVLLAIPTSIVGAFIALYFFGFTLNTFTLLGLSLAIGIVVDDAIMMLENIVRHNEMGKNRRVAALEGSKEITFAAIAATLAIAAIFVPVIFMQGVVGRFFYQYGITVTVAVFLSLLEALTLTPMRCARFLHSAKDHGAGWVLRHMDAFMNSLSEKYQKGLKWTLSHRGSVMTASIIFFAGSMLLLSSLRQELIPQQDQSLFLMHIKTPVGTSIWASDEVFKQAEKYLISQPEVKDYYTTIGNYENNDIVNAGSIYVILKDPKLRKLTQREVMDKTRTNLQKLLPTAQVFAQDLSLAGFSATRGYPIEFTVEGPDWTKLSSLSKTIMDKIQATGMVQDVNTDFQDGMPEIHVVPDRDRAANHGISINSMGSEVSTLIGGQMFTADTQYPKDGHRYDIRVRSEDDGHNDPKQIDEILLRNNRAEADLVRLADASDIKVSSAIQLISRLNRQRAIPVYANVTEGVSQQAALSKVEEIGKKVLPTGYQILMTGSAQAFRDAFQSLVFALILGVIVAYMVLASQFNSFIHPVTVLMALPFSLSGAFVALFFTHQSLNLFSMIGLILLMGIVKKNSILLVDFTNQRRSEGLDANQALIEACPVRLRPILMTSVATVAGAIPAALALGPGAETRIPMSISIIGGVIVSTLLTLFAVPCVYSLFSRFERPELPDED